VKRALLAALLLLLGACASFPENPHLEHYAKDAGYRFERLQHAGNSDSLFVIVTFSGGGTRAAALAYGVLEALRDTSIEWQGHRESLLDEVDVISSISGGSFPAAYYALRGRKTFDEFPDKFLYRPIQDDLLRLALTPTNWFRLAAPSFGRSDLAAEFYDREVFGGGTYADVIARNRRPFVVLNATDMTTGAQFPFIQDEFDLLCSDLAGVPLARAPSGTTPAAAATASPPGSRTPRTTTTRASTRGAPRARRPGFRSPRRDRRGPTSTSPTAASPTTSACAARSRRSLRSIIPGACCG